MKKLLIFLLVAACACQKQISTVDPSSTILLRNLQTALKDSLTSADWLALGW